MFSGAVCIMNRNGFLFFFLLIGSVIVLVVSSFVGIRCSDRGSTDDGLVFHSVDIRDETLRPPDVREGISLFPGNTRVLCLRFRYETLDNGCAAQILWFHDGALIKSEEIVLTPGVGTKCLCLSLREALPLPSGGYEVRIASGSGVRWNGRFVVSGDR